MATSHVMRWSAPAIACRASMVSNAALSMAFAVRVASPRFDVCMRVCVSSACARLFLFFCCLFFLWGAAGTMGGGCGWPLLRSRLLRGSGTHAFRPPCHSVQLRGRGGGGALLRPVPPVAALGPRWTSVPCARRSCEHRRSRRRRCVELHVVGPRCECHGAGRRVDAEHACVGALIPPRARDSFFVTVRVVCCGRGCACVRVRIVRVFALAPPCAGLACECDPLRAAAVKCGGGRHPRRDAEPS
jgi:hypothetical protein